LMMVLSAPGCICKYTCNKIAYSQKRQEELRRKCGKKYVYFIQEYLMTIKRQYFEQIERRIINWPCKNKVQVVFLVIFFKNALYV
jgi:hypothetical protein